MASRPARMPPAPAPRRHRRRLAIGAAINAVGLVLLAAQLLAAGPISAG